MVNISVAYIFTATSMETQSEMRLLQIGPGISTSYTIFSRESSSSEAPGTHIGRIGDIFLSLTTLHFKNYQDQWITVAEGDLIHHPIHQNCDLLLSTTGPRWGFDCQPSLTIVEAIKQHWNRINSGLAFMPEDEDDLDDAESDDDWDNNTEEEEE